MRLNILKLLIICFCLLQVTNCRKRKIAVYQMPPETQSGKGVVAFRANGTVLAAIAPGYVDYPFPVAGKFFGFYQYTQGKYFLSVNGRNVRNSRQPGWSFILITDSVQLYQGAKIELKKRTRGSGFAIIWPPPANSGEHLTTNNEKGELTITKLDSAKRILSGRFWFDAKDTLRGKTIQVRDGFFDFKF